MNRYNTEGSDHHSASYKSLSLTFRSLVVDIQKPCCSEHEALIILARSLMTISNKTVWIVAMLIRPKTFFVSFCFLEGIVCFCTFAAN